MFHSNYAGAADAPHGRANENAKVSVEETRPFLFAPRASKQESC